MILPRGQDVLLTVKSNPDPDIQLPGGGIDPGEPVRPALYREVMEETGWRIGAPRRVGAFRRFVFMPEYDLWAEKVCQIYVARPTLQICDPLEENHEPIWMNFELATQLIGNPADRAFLAGLVRSGYPL